MTTVFKMAHGVAVQKLPLTIARLLPDPATPTYSEEWMTATGTRLSELNAERISKSAGMTDSMSMTAANSTTTTTSFAEAFASIIAVTQEPVTTSSAATPSAIVVATTSDEYYTSAQEPDDESTFAIWDPATTDIVATTGAAEPPAITAITITVPPPSSAPCLNSTTELLASNTTTLSPKTVTAFTTSYLSTITVSPTLAISQDTTTATASNQTSAASLEMISDTSEPSFLTATAATSPTEAGSSSVDTSSDVKTSKVVVGGPLQASSTSGIPGPVFDRPISSSASSTRAQNTVVPLPPYTPSMSAFLQARDSQAHHPPSTLQSRYHHLNSPITLWLAVSILLSTVLWRLITIVFACRRANHEFDLPIHNLNFKPLAQN